MKEQLIKAMQRNQLLNMMYMAKNGNVSKRRIKIIKIVGDSFQAYCFTRQAKRTFMIDNVLAVVPISHKDRSVVC
ncbi:transcriptional regulator [Lysinibacillus fusiformis]|uniref:transcriptional regulator n=1 Tax=Lysinibacillus fusiformis TaxID=28031 RepID=UPI000B7DEA2B|nr:transcriptional regulator [Lysinibacillus fusiformis]